jgi:hypothetical protein
MKSTWNGWTWNEYGQQLKRNKRIISNRDSQERIEMRKKNGGHATCGPSVRRKKLAYERYRKEKKMVGTQHVGPSVKTRQ